MSEEELTQLREEVDKYQIEGDLRRFNNLNIKRLKEINCYRGRRHTVVRLAVVHALLSGAHAAVLVALCPYACAQSGMAA